MQETLALGFQVMVYGLAGVFMVLVLFFVIAKAMVYFSNKAEMKKEKDKERQKEILE